MRVAFFINGEKVAEGRMRGGQIQDFDRSKAPLAWSLALAPFTVIALGTPGGSIDAGQGVRRHLAVD